MKLNNILSVLSITFLLSSVVFVSGCVDSDGSFSFLKTLGFGGETKIAPKDVLLVENIQIIPTPPITADSTFSVGFQVVNVGETEDSKRARNVDVYIYDWGRCHLLDSDGNDVTNEVYYAWSDDREIYPGGGAELVDWSFRAPSNTELGRMDGSCPIRFKVEYDFDAHTTSDISVVSRERLTDASRAGDEITVNPIQTQSRGPLKISVNYDAEQPVAQGLIIPVIIRVEDTGSGMYERIEPDMLRVTFPPGFDSDEIKCHNFDMANRGTYWSNGANISLIAGRTPIIRCDMYTDGLSIQDVKTYTVRADMIGYRYPLYEETSVGIKSTYDADLDEGGSGGGDSGDGDSGDGDSGDGDSGDGDGDTSSELCANQGTDCSCATQTECTGFDQIGERGAFDCDSGEYCCCDNSGGDTTVACADITPGCMCTSSTDCFGIATHNCLGDLNEYGCESGALDCCCCPTGTEAP